MGPCMSFDLPNGIDLLQSVQGTWNIGPSQDPVDDEPGVLFQKDTAGIHVPKESLFKNPFNGPVPFNSRIYMYTSLFHFDTKLRHYYITQYMCHFAMGGCTLSGALLWKGKKRKVLDVSLDPTMLSTIRPVVIGFLAIEQLFMAQYPVRSSLLHHFCIHFAYIQIPAQFSK